jgi:hypothetical protein
MKKTKPKRTGRVTSVSVSRLYNLGNYENVKYELSAEVTKGASPSETLAQLANTISALKPVTKPPCQASLNAARKKKISERSEYEKEQYSSWLEAERTYNALKKARVEGVLELDKMGATSTATDHKQNWEDDNVPF